MRWYQNMKISAKLFLGFSLILIGALAIGTVGILNLRTITTNSDTMYEHMTVPIAELSQIATSFQRIRVNMRDIILADDPAKYSYYEERAEERRKEMTEHSEVFAETILSQDMRDAYDAFLATRVVFGEYYTQIMALAKEGKDDEALALLNSDACYEAEQAEQNAILNLAAMKAEDAHAESLENQALSNQSMMTMIYIIIGVFAFAIIAALYISRLISSSMKRITAAAEGIADGDLCQQVNIDTKDEIGKLAAAFRKMVQNLNEVLSGINAASEQVSSGAAQLADSSTSLSQGASEQASSIEEVTASLEQISAQTRQNAKNAGEANRLAETARENAEDGNEQMQGMVKAMEDINVSSANISKIIKVIEDIAFQTNILALNAAVEAARAGESGKGFAVVAEEVRNLAARSANAVKETTEMIEGSVRKVEAGTKLANRTAEALVKIVSGTAEAASLVKQIDVASNEQATGLAQINQAVMQVSEVVQANSAVSEQSAAASKELAGQAEMMRESVSKFKLLQDADAPSRTNAPRGYEAREEVAEPPRSEKKKMTIALSDEEFSKY